MRLFPRAATAAMLALLVPAAAFSQTTDAPRTLPEVGSTFSADAIRDLPFGNSVYSILENTQSEVIADRFNSGGLNVGGDVRFGGFLGSWSQTLFRVGDVDISDPTGSGSPLLIPDTALWQRVSVHTSLMPGDVNTPGLAVTLEPARGGSAWTRVFSGSGSGGSLVSPKAAAGPFPVARLLTYQYGSGVVSGPLSPTSRLVAGVTIGKNEAFTREVQPADGSSVMNGFASVVSTPSADREWRAFGWVQQAKAPLDAWQAFRGDTSPVSRTAVHLQATLDQHTSGRSPWRVFAGFTQRSRTFDIPSTTVVLDRLVNGPVQQLLDSGADTTSRRMEVGARLTPLSDASAMHHLDYGIGATGATTSTSELFAGTAREFIDTTPARIWTVTAPTATSNRQTSTAYAFANDRIVLSPRASIDAGVRLEYVLGRVTGGATNVSWIDALPHLRYRFEVTKRRSITFGYQRSGNQLTHNWLAFGDPGASTATVAAAAAPSIVVSRVGPGTAGNAAFSRVDDSLKRPVTDELTIAWERRHSERTRYTLTGIARWETHMLGVVNTGVPSSSYSTLSLPDAGKDLINPKDDRQLVVYNRLPVSFAQDAYLLTNPDQKRARAFALRMQMDHQGDRLFVLFGATAGMGQGAVTNRGYGPNENDQDQPGELFTNPNAASYAYGRLFADRAFTIKWTTMYRFPWDVTIGGIARYQDGQPFSRMVVVPSLNQGAEGVQSYPNGGSRYTFTGTFDLRVQKAFRIGSARVAAVFDAYNLFTRNNEVEEYVVSSPAFRTPTWIEPPHSMHVGLRVSF